MALEQPEIRTVTLSLLPGVFTEQTARGSTNRWKSANYVRWFEGLAQKLGGWQAAALTGGSIGVVLSNGALQATPIIGVPRAIHEWTDLSANAWEAIGTNSKLYITNQLIVYDITPLRVQITGGANPFTSTNTLPTVSVLIPLHGANAGDFVTFAGATAGAGFTAAQMNRQFQITSITDGNNFVITLDSNATSSVAFGGSAVVASFDLNAGLASPGFWYGWGVGGWGQGTWGTPRGSSTMQRPIQLWSLDNWGQGLMASPSQGPVYYWDPTYGTGSRAQNITNAPQSNQRMLVSPDSRQLICLGSQHNGVNDTLFIQTSDNNNYQQFVASATNNVYNGRLSSGSKIVTGVRTNSGILVVTDISAYLMQPTGDQNVYALRQIAENVSIMGQNACVESNGNVYIMGTRKFYIYNGYYMELPCDMWTYVYGNINLALGDKVCAFINGMFPEVWFCYPSALATENDSVVIYNYTDKCWYPASLVRTAGINRSEAQTFLNFPLMLDATGTMWIHESGYSAGGANPMNSYAQSYDVQFSTMNTTTAATIAIGEEQMHVSRMVPDYVQQQGNMNVTFYTKRYPNDGYVQKGPFVLSPTTSSLSLRARGKLVSYQIQENTSLFWRTGYPSFEIQADGER